MLKKMITERTYCGLDIGCQKIKAAVVKHGGQGEVEFLGAFAQTVRGFDQKSVSDLYQFADCVDETLSRLSEKTGADIKTVSLGLSGETADVRLLQTTIPLVDRGTKVITERDVRRVRDQVRLLGVRMDEELLDELPVKYLVDEQNPVSNPVGLFGRTLGVEALMIYSQANRVRNIVRAVNQAGYEVGHTFFSSTSAAQNSLTDSDRKKGCALVDIGSCSTTVLSYKDGILRSIDKIPWGGNHITEGIAARLGLKYDLAEDLKKSYARASRDSSPEDEVLIQKDDQYKPVKRSEIDQISLEQVETFTDLLYTTLRETHIYEQMNAGIIFIGGGALLPGLIEYVMEETRSDSRLGYIDLKTAKNIHNAVLFSAVIGLAQNNAALDSKKSSDPLDGQPWSKRMARKLSEIYHEYF